MPEHVRMHGTLNTGCFGSHVVHRAHVIGLRECDVNKTAASTQLFDASAST